MESQIKVNAVLPLLAAKGGNTKIEINGKDVTKSVRRISIEAGFDALTIVKAEFYADVNVSVEAEDGITK